MKPRIFQTFLFVLALSVVGCKPSGPTEKTDASANVITHSNGLSIHRYDGFSVVKVREPWPGATKEYSYVLVQKGASVPDSLSVLPVIAVPVKSIVVTSTTHIPSLEMLGVENALVGFPGLDYISSEKVRARIDSKNVKELGSNQSLNTEVLLDLSPDVIIGYGIDNNNPTLTNLEKSGLKVVLNGDWNEQTSLGKAEWIKLFGELSGKTKQADSIFAQIEKDYNATLALAKSAKRKPSVMAGSMFENKWYLPQGNSWGAQLISDAGGAYLWANSKGTGSLSLPFETVLEKANAAEFWIGPGQFDSYSGMLSDNPHYGQFAAVQNKKVFSFSSKKGKTGGIIYYELAPNRPDLVLKDLVAILHPELLPDYQLYFFEPLK